MDRTSIENTLTLFKAVVLNRPLSKQFSFSDNRDLINTLVKQGIALDPMILQTATREELLFIVDTAIDLYGFNATKLNSTFWKRYEDVEWSNEQYLEFVQSLHYTSTYGQGIVGKKGESWEPEKLDKIDVQVLSELVYIQGISENELQEKVANMLESGAALKEDTIERLLQLIDAYSLTIDPNKIKNKEAMCRLCMKLHLIPKDFSEFTRLMLYATTESTLLIQSQDKVNEIITETRDGEKYADAYILFKQYVDKYGIFEVADHISRYRKLYLAFRCNAPEDVKKIINKAFKKSKIYHEKMPKLPLENVNDSTVSESSIYKALDKAPIYKLAKIASALRYSDISNRLFRIRNGKSYLQLDHLVKADPNRSGRIYNYILSLIEKRLDFTNKLFYIPEVVTYAVPTSEKQFVGSLPYLTKFYVPYNDVSVGVAWEQECDLDLHGISAYGKHIGWDAMHRNENITFSGDMTHTNQYGYAAEYFKIKNTKDLEPYIISLNNFSNGRGAKFDVFITDAPVNTSSSQGVAKQLNDRSFLFKDVMDQNSKVLLTVIPLKYGFQIALCNMDFGNVHVPGVNDLTKNLSQVIRYQTNSVLDITDLIKAAGGVVLNDKQDFVYKRELLLKDGVSADDLIDLSPSKVTASTFIDLLTPNK